MFRSAVYGHLTPPLLQALTLILYSDTIQADNSTVCYLIAVSYLCKTPKLSSNPFSLFFSSFFFNVTQRLVAVSGPSQCSR